MEGAPSNFLSQFLNATADNDPNLAGSMLMPSPSTIEASVPFRDSHISSSANARSFVACTSNESDLSEAKDTPPVTHPSPNQPTKSAELDMEDVSSEPSGNNPEGSADGEYDMETPPAQQSTDAEGSLSEGSLRPAKRKSPMEADEYITMDPELYGLRRSV